MPRCVSLSVGIMVYNCITIPITNSHKWDSILNKVDILNIKHSVCLFVMLIFESIHCIYLKLMIIVLEYNPVQLNDLNRSGFYEQETHSAPIIF